MSNSKTLTTQTTAPPPPKPRWVKGALVRGFFSAVQAYEAANLTIALLLPDADRSPVFKKLTGGSRALTQKVAQWEDRMKPYDIDPGDHGHMKSATSFILFNAAYILPLIAAGVAVGMAGGETAAVAAAVLINTHSTMGEALIQTSRHHKGDIANRAALEDFIAGPDGNRLICNNALIKGGITCAFTLAAGPVSRALGGFTDGALRSLSRTALGSILSEQFVKAANIGLFRSIHAGLTVVFADAAIGWGKGPAKLLVKAITPILLARLGASALYRRIARRTDPSLPGDETVKAPSPSGNAYPSLPSGESRTSHTTRAPDSP